MLINADSVNSVIITSSTVNADVGICYFNPVTESLLEISAAPNHFMSLKPLEQTILKYYLVVSPGIATPSYVKIRVKKDNIEDYYTIKTILGEVQPSIDDFVSIPNFNSFKVVSPTVGAFIPIWFLVSSVEQVNEVLTFNIEIEYE